MLTYDLKKKERNPLYEQLYKCIRDDIINGDIGAGERLPSKRSLAAHLGISITTVENAYGHLRAEGYVKAMPNSGFYVTDNYKEGKNGSAGAYESEARLEIGSIDDSVNEKLFPISVWTKLMRQVISDTNISLLHKVPWNGVFMLREAISNYLRSYKGINADPDRIVVGAGTEYLYSRLLQLLGPSAIIGYEDPGYRRLPQIATKNGIMQRFVSIDDQGMSVEKLRESNANVVHVSPGNHFPTGAVMSRERREELISWADEDPYRFIIEFDYDSEFAEKGRPIPTLFSMDQSDRVIYMNSFSRTLVPSIQISYMILPQSLYQLYRQSQDFYACTVSGFEQLTLARFISDGYFERHLNRLRNSYREKRDAFCEAIEDSALKDKITIESKTVSTHLLMCVNTSMSDDEIRERSKAAGVQMSLLSDYCQFPKVSNLHTMIINYAGIEKEEIGQAIDMICQILKIDP